MTDPLQLDAWTALRAHHADMQDTSLRDLFAADNQRFDTFQLSAAGIFLDFSKNHINAQTHQLLVALAEASGVQPRIQRMFDGEIVNPTEGRPALHTALRNRSERPVLVDAIKLTALFI